MKKHITDINEYTLFPCVFAVVRSHFTSTIDGHANAQNITTTMLLLLLLLVLLMLLFVVVIVAGVVDLAVLVVLVSNDVFFSKSLVGILRLTGFLHGLFSGGCCCCGFCCCCCYSVLLLLLLLLL